MYSIELGIKLIEDFSVRVENKLIEEQYFSVFVIDIQMWVMETVGGIWFGFFLFRIIIIYKVVLIFIDLLYLFWCFIIKKKKVGFEIQGYFIKMIKYLKYFL